MARTLSTMMELGTSAPSFKLPDLNGEIISDDQFINKPMLVMFICNHCPYVKHVIHKLAALAKDYQSRGVAVVAINSNDTKQYPDDAPQKMKALAAEYDFSFPYLFDESQSVAKAYRAACTPDFYLFNAEHKLVYRGQMDESRPGTNVPITGRDLTAAVHSLVEGKPIFENQLPSMGCNIKWKPGNEPDYFG
ncbi:thioredoxin family protein [candidate division KSB1 bacterium]|nr:thioredoxin family protein [candidate division KSB1 bacterium]RQW00993.1 MAG: thioredoxin family protein [candidate division KSB1 bacterium]